MKTPLIVTTAVLALAVPLVSNASPGEFAVWMDGQTSDGGNPIDTELDTMFGAGSAVLVTSAQLDTPGFLAANGFSAVVVTREGSNFGTNLDATAVANIQAYVGTAGSAGQGGVAVFTNDAADNLGAGDGGDPGDPDITQLFQNAATFAAASGHGYLGEFNGAAQAFASNTYGATPLDLLTGSAGPVGAQSGGAQNQFVYGVGPIGAGNAIDAGVTFPFTDADETTYLTIVTGANPNNIVDIYTDPSTSGDPAVLANQFVITRGKPSNGAPDAASTTLLLALGLVAMLAVRRLQPAM